MSTKTKPFQREQTRMSTGVFEGPSGQDIIDQNTPPSEQPREEEDETAWSLLDDGPQQRLRRILCGKANMSSHSEFLADFPDVVRIAIKVLLNHIEPGYENCKTLVSDWLEQMERKGPQ